MVRLNMIQKVLLNAVKENLFDIEIMKTNKKHDLVKELIRKVRIQRETGVTTSYGLLHFVILTECPVKL